MDESVTPPLRSSRRFLRRVRANHQRKHARRAALSNTPFFDEQTATAAPPAPARRIRRLARQPHADGAAFQGVAVAALHTLDRVGRCERHAAEAALSLAQRQKLQDMAGVVDATAQALRETLSVQGAAILRQHPAAPAGTPPDASWGPSLCETLGALEEGVAWSRSVAAGQPPGGPTRALSGVVVRLLQHHYDVLRAEAEQWTA